MPKIPNNELLREQRGESPDEEPSPADLVAEELSTELDLDEDEAAMLKIVGKELNVQDEDNPSASSFLHVIKGVQNAFANKPEAQILARLKTKLEQRAA